MEPGEPLPTDSLERRRLQNRSAQRKFRNKRSMNRAAQAAQLDSTSSTSTTSTATPQSGLSWSGRQQNNLCPGSFASGDNQLQHQTFDSIDFQGIFQASNAMIDDINYPISDTEVSVFSGLNASIGLTSPSLLRIGGHDFSFEALEANSPVNITPPNGNTGTDLPTSFSHSSTPAHKPDPRAFPTPPFYQGPQSLRPPSRHLHPASGSISELDAYARHHHNSNPERSESVPMSNDWLPALHIAAQKGHDRIVRILLERDVSINEKDSDGKTALHFSTIEGHEAVVRLLLAHGARIDEPDCDGRTSIHWAVLQRYENMLRLLLDHSNAGCSVDIDAFDKNGWTALHTAVERGFEAGLQLLLQHGADLNIKARRCPYTGNLILPGQEIRGNTMIAG